MWERSWIIYAESVRRLTLLPVDAWEPLLSGAQLLLLGLRISEVNLGTREAISLWHLNAAK